jgi:predicted metalloprotease
VKGVVALLLALFVGTACLVGPGQEEPATPTTEPTGATPEADEFQRDVQAAAEVAREYWQAQFSASGERFQPIRRIIPYQRDGEVTCGGQPLTRNNAAYCVPEDFLAYDVNWAARAFTVLGDAFVYYLLGHEYAHGVQVRLGIEFQFSIEQELQADCFAGAYLGDSVRAGRLLLEDGDLDELRAGLAAVADDPDQPWFAENAHGTAEQRTDAFFAGYERSLAACGSR